MSGRSEVQNLPRSGASVTLAVAQPPIDHEQGRSLGPDHAQGIYDLGPLNKVLRADGKEAEIPADMRDAGSTPEECVADLENRKKNINTYYTTNDLKYLYRSGRVSKAGVIVATALNINPILNLDKEGKLIVQEKIRGRKNAFERIYAIVKELVIAPETQTVYICHSDCRPEEVRSFSDTLLERFHFKGSFISYIGPTIGSHSGPGLIAAFFEGQPRF